MNTKSIITIDISNPTALPTDGSQISGSLVSEYALTFPDNCSSGEMRPFALKFHKGVGYLGVVCDASISKLTSDLKAYVYRFNPTNIADGLTKELEFDLD